mmetsp:Transcript_2911/g.6316  ORF Transcript_2911/g.6316 Transcript_2911/m.6316 type:complete len:125 (-) Transcript_2911:83-457(-)
MCRGGKRRRTIQKLLGAKSLLIIQGYFRHVDHCPAVSQSREHYFRGGIAQTHSIGLGRSQVSGFGEYKERTGNSKIYEQFSICSVTMKELSSNTSGSDPQFSRATSFGALVGYLFGKNEQSKRM